MQGDQRRKKTKMCYSVNGQRGNTTSLAITCTRRKRDAKRTGVGWGWRWAMVSKLKKYTDTT